MVQGGVSANSKKQADGSNTVNQSYWGTTGAFLNNKARANKSKALTLR